MGSQVFLAGSSGNFIVPPDVFKLVVNMAAGGGGGGFGNRTGGAEDNIIFGGQGGGGGGCILNYSLSVTPGQVIPYSVGYGGIGEIGWNYGRTPGGNTSFGTLICYGGDGAQGPINPGAGNGGSATDGTYTALGGAAGIPGADGSPGEHVTTPNGELYGGGGGGGGNALDGGDVGSYTGNGGSSYSSGGVWICWSGGGGSLGVGSRGANWQNVPYSANTAGIGGGGGGDEGSSPGGNGKIELTWERSPSLWFCHA